MHIAVVTPYLPHPQDTGERIRVAKLARALAAQGRIQLFSAITSEDEAAEAERAGLGLEPYARVVTHGLHARRTAILRSDRPGDFVFPDALTLALRAANDARPFDAVVVFHNRAGVAARDLVGTTLVVDEPELDSVVVKRRVAGSRANWLMHRLQLRRWQQVEDDVWKRADAVTSARAEDAERIRSVAPDKGIHVPDGIDVESFEYRPPSRRQGNAILFVGRTGSGSHEAAARILAREVLPRVRQTIRDATLTIAGRSPSNAMMALADDDVRVTGTVATLSSLYAGHAAFVVPVVSQSTLKLRLLEPLACGLPLIAPPSVARDLGLSDREHYFAAATTEQTVEAVIQVLGRRVALDAMTLAGRRVAEQRDWDVVGSKFARIVMAAVVRRRG